MEPLQLKQRKPAEEIECWDDDEDFLADDFHFKAPSRPTTSTSSHFPHHRDSIASRLSVRSDFDSNHGEDECQVIVPADDEASASKAIASVINAGIPIPKDVPSSALVGGTIKRLGAKKSKKVVSDVWGDDLEFPTGEDANLTIKKRNESAFPDSLRHVSAESSRPQSPSKPMTFAERINIHAQQQGNPILDRFRDGEDDEDIFGDFGGQEVATVKARKPSTRPSATSLSPPDVSPAVMDPVEDFTADLELPSNGEPLKLPERREPLKMTPVSPDDFDEWTEGSLGTRHGGTRHERRSGRSSSFSAMSPSLSSSFTVESEDDGLEGLLLPAGPVNFKEMLESRQQNQSPDPGDFSGEQQAQKRAAAKDDFFSGLEIGDGDVFDSGKKSLNKNVKHKITRPTSPSRRTALSFTFTQKPPTTKLPRPRSSHDRGSGSKLEPVSEAPDAVPAMPRPHSRFGLHMSGSPSSIPVPTSTAAEASMPSTPSRKPTLSNRTSMRALRPEPTTTGSQLLKSKRSMPSMRDSPGKTYTSSQRPPSRQEHQSRPNHPLRPKTPVGRPEVESSLSMARKHPVPFLPAGTSHSQHVAAKTTRSFRRHDSESSMSGEHRPTSRMTFSRAGLRSPSPKRRDFAPTALARAAASKHHMSRPHGRKQYGDGNELEVFDDLPTSAAAESKFVKAPISRGPPKVRGKLGSNLPDRSVTPALHSPSVAFSPSRNDALPRFARDTNASRIAREQRIQSSTAVHPPTAPSTQTKAPFVSRSATLAGANTLRSKRRPSIPEQKEKSKRPQLIKPMGNAHQNPKVVKQMKYNPDLCRWEGNENALASFDAPPSTQSFPSPSTHTQGSVEKKADRQIALISNIGPEQGVRVEGGMVFDPLNFRWLKLSHHQRQQSRQRSHTSGSAPMSPIGGTTEGDDDSDDPFAGLDDLDDGKASSVAASTNNAAGTGKQNSFGEASAQDEWLVGEEFDVGPEFIRRQREEESVWRQKVERWIRTDERENRDWTYLIRDIARLRAQSQALE